MPEGNTKQSRLAKRPSLLILAAGMGSRFGGLKQLEALGPYGETILEYSVFDAMRAGFGKVVFVIRRDFEEQFREKVISRFEGQIETECVFQDMDALPAPFTCPPERVKPWGTSHAVLAAKDVIKTSFAVINADDFYGADAFRKLTSFLPRKPEEFGTQAHFCLVAYRLDATLSENGTVSRGICEVSPNGNLVTITEREKIRSTAKGPQALIKEDTWELLRGDTPVSMNMIGFTPTLFPLLEEYFAKFLTQNRERVGAECYLPAAVADAIAKGNASVQVLHTNSKWMGITYPADKQHFSEEIAHQSSAGIYPAPLWEKSK